MQRRLTLVSAPAGFGKTTLIASWLHGLSNRKPAPPRIAWISLEDDDGDPARFFTYLIAALQTIDPCLGKTAQTYLDAPRVPSPQHLMTLLLNDLTHLDGQSVLVLDDYHVLRQDELRAAVAFFVEHLPPNVHLVIAAREEPLLSLPRLRAQQDVSEIRLSDLRFTQDEARAFLRRSMGLSLTVEAASAIEERTEGWIAGLQMAALSLRRADPNSAPDYTALANAPGEHEIIDYLAAEVLRQQPAEIRTFLHRTAILDRFNGSLADAVSGRQDSGTLLPRLEKANLFLIPLDGQRQWFRYHHLFADFLRLELAESEQRTLHTRASQWHELNGYIAEGIKHALAARDYAAAVRLIRRGRDEVRRSGGFNILLGWINSLPDEVVREHSDLLVHKGWIAYMRGERLTGEAYAALALERASPDDPPSQRGMLFAFRAYLALNREQPAQAMKFAREALSLLGEPGSYYSSTALTYLGQAQRLLGDRQAAVQTLRRAIALGRELGGPANSMEALRYLVLLLYQQGDLREAILLCEEAARHYSDSTGNSLPVAGLAYVPLGTLYYETNDLANAHHYLSTGVSLCQELWGGYGLILGRLALARLHFARGETEAAWDNLANARQLAATSSSKRHFRTTIATTAELQLQQGLIAKAEATLMELPGAERERSEHENLTFARLMITRRQSEKAQTLLGNLEQTARAEGRLGSLIRIHVVQAVNESAMQSNDAALEFTRKAIGLAASEGYRRIFLDEKTAIAGLLAQLRDAAPEFVSGLLEAFTSGAPPSSQESRQEAMMEPLTRNQLAILRLVAEGLSNREIAARMTITEGTAKWHLNEIYTKLNVSSRTQALVQARELRLL